MVGALHAPAALAQEPAAQPAPEVTGRGRGPIPVDPRVQIWEYPFTDTNEKILYAVFVSSKVRRDQKAPLIIALHGLGGSPTSLLRGNALDFWPKREDTSSWARWVQPSQVGTGTVDRPRRSRPGHGCTGPGRRAAGYPAAGRQGPPPGAFVNANDPPNLRELSEKDVVNVLELVRKEFNVDISGART